MCYSKFLNLQHDLFRSNYKSLFRDNTKVFLKTNKYFCHSLSGTDDIRLKCPFCPLFRGAKCYLLLQQHPEVITLDSIFQYVQSNCFRLTFPFKTYVLEAHVPTDISCSFQRKIYRYTKYVRSRYGEVEALPYLEHLFDLAGRDFGYVAGLMEEGCENSEVLFRISENIRGFEKQLGLGDLLRPLTKAIVDQVSNEFATKLKVLDWELFALSVLDLFSICLLYTSADSLPTKLAVGILTVSACYKMVRALKDLFTPDVDDIKERLTSYFSDLSNFRSQSFDPRLCLNIFAGALALMLGVGSTFSTKVRATKSALKDFSSVTKDVKNVAAYIVEDLFGYEDKAKQELQAHLSELEVEGRRFLAKDMAALTTEDIAEMTAWEETVRKETAIICKNHAIQLPLEFTNTHTSVVSTLNWLRASTYHDTESIEPVNIWITGERGCGKTTFVSDYLAGVLGKLIGEESDAVYDMTEAGNYWPRLGNHWIARVDELGSSSTPEKSTNKITPAMLLQLCGQTKVPLETAELQGKYQVPKFKLIVFCQNSPPGHIPLGLGANSKEPFYSRLNCFRMIDMHYDSKLSRFDQKHRKADYSHCCFVPTDAHGHALGSETLTTNGLIKFLAYQIKKRQASRGKQLSEASDLLVGVENAKVNYTGVTKTEYFDFDLDAVLPNKSTASLPSYAPNVDLFNYRTKSTKANLTGATTSKQTFYPRSVRGKNFSKQSSDLLGCNIKSIHLYGTQGKGKTMFLSSSTFARALGVYPTYVDSLYNRYTKQGVFIVDDKVVVGDLDSETKFSNFYDALPSGSVVVTVGNVAGQISYNPLKAWKLYRKRPLTFLFLFQLFYTLFRTDVSYPTRKGGFARRYGLQGFDSFNSVGTLDTLAETFTFLGTGFRTIYGDIIDAPAFISKINTHLAQARKDSQKISFTNVLPVFTGNPLDYDLVIVTNEEVNAVSAGEWYVRLLRGELSVSTRLLQQLELLNDFADITFTEAELERIVFRLRSAIPNLRLFLSSPVNTLHIEPERVTYYRPDCGTIDYDEETNVFTLSDGFKIPLGLAQAILIRDCIYATTPADINLHIQVLNSSNHFVKINGVKTEHTFHSFVRTLPIKSAPLSYIIRPLDKEDFPISWKNRLWRLLVGVVNSKWVLIALMAIGIYALLQIIKTVKNFFTSDDTLSNDYFFKQGQMASPADQDLDELYRRLERAHQLRELADFNVYDDWREEYNSYEDFDTDLRKNKTRKRGGYARIPRATYEDPSELDEVRDEAWFMDEHDEVLRQAKNLREHKLRGGERLNQIDHFIKLMAPGNKYGKQSLAFTPLEALKRRQVRKGDPYSLQGPVVDSARLPGYYTTILQNYGTVYYSNATRSFGMALNGDYVLTQGHGTSLDDKAFFHFTSMVEPLTITKIYEVPNQDLAIWIFADKISPQTQRPFKDLTKFLISDRDIFSLTDMMVLRTQSGQAVPLHGDFALIQGYDLPGETSLNARTQHFAFDWRAYDKPQAGDCGMPYLGMVRGQYRFLGIHIGLQNARKVSVVSFLSKEMFNAFLSTYVPQGNRSLFVPVDLSTTVEQRPAFEGSLPDNLVTLRELPLTAYLGTSIKDLYTEPPTVGFHENSKVCLSVARLQKEDSAQMYWHGDGKKATEHSEKFSNFPSGTSPVLDIHTLKRPANLDLISKLDKNNLGYFCQHETRMKAEFEARGPSEIKTVEPEVIQSVIACVKAKVGPIRFLSPDEALSGRSGVAEVGRMVINTSTGFFDPNDLPRTLTKDKIFDVNEETGKVTWKSSEDAFRIREEVLLYWKAAREGKTLLLPFFNNFKTECLPEEKIHKPRVFNSAPLAHLIFAKQVLGDLVAKLTQDFEFGFTIKIDPRLSWNNVWRYFTKNAPNIYCKAISMDFKCFDRTIPASLFEALKEILVGVITDTSGGFTDEEMKNVVSCLVDSLRCRFMISGDYFYVSTQGQASGIYATSFLDTFLNLIALADFAYVKLGLRFDTFLQKFSVLGHGDDSALNTTEEMSNRFSPTDLQNFLFDNYGLRAVNADNKEDETLAWINPREVSFCSRKFFKIPSSALMTSKLKKSSVLTSLHWARTHLSYPVLAAEWREILEEYWPYGREEFNRLRTLMEALIKEKGYTYATLFPTFEEVRVNRMIGTIGETRAYDRGLALQASRRSAKNSLQSVFENFNLSPGKPFLPQMGGPDLSRKDLTEDMFLVKGADMAAHLIGLLKKDDQSESDLITPSMLEDLANFLAFDLLHFDNELVRGKVLRKRSSILFNKLMSTAEQTLIIVSSSEIAETGFNKELQIKTYMANNRDIPLANLAPLHTWNIETWDKDLKQKIKMAYLPHADYFLDSYARTVIEWVKPCETFSHANSFATLRLFYTSLRNLREVSISLMRGYRRDLILERKDPYADALSGAMETDYDRDVTLVDDYVEEDQMDEVEERLPDLSGPPKAESRPAYLEFLKQQKGQPFVKQVGEVVAPPVNEPGPTGIGQVEAKTPQDVKATIPKMAGPDTSAPISELAVDNALLPPEPVLTGAYDAEAMTAFPKNTVYPSGLSDADPSQLGYAKDMKEFAWRRVPVKNVSITSNTAESTIIHTQTFDPFSRDCVGKRAADYANYHRSFQGDLCRYYKLYTNQIFFGSVIVAYIPAYITIDLEQITVEDLRQFPWMEITANDTKFASMIWQPTTPGPEYQMFIDRSKTESGLSYGMEVVAIFSNVQNAFGSEIQIQLKIESQLSPTAKFFNPDLLSSDGITYGNGSNPTPPDKEVDLTSTGFNYRLNIDGQQQEPLWAQIAQVSEGTEDWQLEEDWSQYPVTWFEAPGGGETSTATVTVFQFSETTNPSQYVENDWTSQELNAPTYNAGSFRWQYGWDSYAKFMGLSGVEQLSQVNLPGASISRDRFNSVELHGLKEYIGEQSSTTPYGNSTTGTLPAQPDEIEVSAGYGNSGLSLNLGLGGTVLFYDNTIANYVYGFGGGFCSTTYLPLLDNGVVSSEAYRYCPMLYDGIGANWISRPIQDIFTSRGSTDTLGNISFASAPLVGPALASDWKQVNFDDTDYKPVPVRVGEKGCAMMRCCNIAVIEYMEEVRGSARAVTFKIKDKLGIFRGQLLYVDYTFYMKYPHGNHAYLPGNFWGSQTDYIAYETQRVEVITELVVTPEMVTREYFTKAERTEKPTPTFKSLVEKMTKSRAKALLEEKTKKTESFDQLVKVIKGSKFIRQAGGMMAAAGMMGSSATSGMFGLGSAKVQAEAQVESAKIASRGMVLSSGLTAQGNIKSAGIAAAANVKSANIAAKSNIYSTQMKIQSSERMAVQNNLANQGAAALSIY